MCASAPSMRPTRPERCAHAALICKSRFERARSAQRAQCRRPWPKGRVSGIKFRCALTLIASGPGDHRRQLAQEQEQEQDLLAPDRSPVPRPAENEALGMGSANIAPRRPGSIGLHERLAPATSTSLYESAKAQERIAARSPWRDMKRHPCHPCRACGR